MQKKSANFDVDTPVDHNFHAGTNDKVIKWESSLPQEYWDYRDKWENFPKKKKVSGFPIHLDIEATSDCNLLCTMCPRTEMIENNTFWEVKRFDLEIYKKIIDEGARLGLCSVKFNYLGEPLLNKKVYEMISYAKEKGIIDVMLNTNATALTEANSIKLLDSGIDKLFFSFDSPNREKYNEIRKGADYDEVLSNIKRFMMLRNERGMITPFTRVSMVLMQENKHEWPEFRRLFEPIVDSVAYVDYLDHGVQKNHDKTAVPIGSRAAKYCCPQLWQRMFVHPDGVVTACCIDSERELVVGNVVDSTIEEIWHGSEYERLRNLHKSGRSEEIPVCARCPLGKY